MSAADAPSYPKIFRLEGRKLAAVYVGIPLLAVLVATLVTQAFDAGISDAGELVLALGFGALVPALLVLMWMATQSRTTLWPDRVEVFDGFAVRSVPGTDLKGFRRARGMGHLKLVPVDAKVRPLRVPASVLNERGALPWLGSLHNLVRDDLAAMTAELERDPHLGSTPAERRAKLRGLRSAGKMIALLGWIIAGWVWLLPVPYSLAVTLGVTMACSALAIHAWSRGLMRLDYWNEDPRPSIAALFFAPALAVFMRAMADINTLDYWASFATGLALSVGLTLLAVWSDRRLPRQGWLLAGIATGSLALSLGALSQANAQLDASAPQLFRTRIVDAYITGGKAHMNELILAPFGPLDKPVGAFVPSRLYENLNEGDEVCVALHGGALGWRWFDVDACKS